MHPPSASASAVPDHVPRPPPPSNFPPKYDYFQPHSSHYNLNSRVMLTAIISLSIIIVIVTILHIYARIILRRQARRRAIIQQLRLAVSQGPPGDQPRSGLDPAVIAALPIFLFKQLDVETAESTECSVCLSSLEDGDMARVLPNCKHIFHSECIDKWLASQPTCPVCRAEAEPRLVPEPRQPETGPPLEGNSSDGESQALGKSGGSSSRLNSVWRMLSMERSSRRNQCCDGPEDLERQ